MYNPPNTVMPLARHYPRAPITEALIDFRVVHNENTKLQSLRQFGADIREAYPHLADRQIMQAQFQAAVGSAAPLAATRTSTIGYIFHSGDRRQAVQARLDGFTFSRFAPYENWPALVSEARRLWLLFVERLQPVAVSRVAVRYINQLNLPLTDGELRIEDYLRTYPHVGEDASQQMEQFFMRLILPQKDLQAQLVLTEAVLPVQQPNTIAVLLDTDLFRENASFEVQSPEIWRILEGFRLRKNEYFEASITDAARELFK